MQQPIHCSLLLFITIIIYSLSLSTHAQFDIDFPFPSGCPSANISKKWTNNNSLQQNLTYQDDVTARAILLRADGPAFACGFFCSGYSCKSFLFSIFLLPYYNGTDMVYDNRANASPQIVWSANRDHPVRENATLEFSENGNLLLRDSDGIQIWSTNTAGQFVVGMKLNEVGSLELFDDNNETVWSSMDYPTDSLVLGQSLKQGQRLTANISITNSSQGPVYLTVNGSIQAFAGSQLYYGYTSGALGMPSNLLFNNGSLGIDGYSATNMNMTLPLANSIQYMQLDYGGHLRIYGLMDSGWIRLTDVFYDLGLIDDCEYPTVCGEYGICSNGHCICPDSISDNLTYFEPVDQNNPSLGCMPINAISCKPNKTQHFLSLRDTYYFNYGDTAAFYVNNTNEESCKQACSKNCFCKAALFKYSENASSGDCYLPSELYSLYNSNPSITGYNSSAFIKVQLFPTTNFASETNSSNFGVIVGASVGSLLALFLVVRCVKALIRRRYIQKEVVEDDEFDKLPGLPTRFTLEDLLIATNDFIRKLGQ